MPSFFDRFRRDGASKSKKKLEAAHVVQPPKLKWEEAWARIEVQPEEVQKLINVCTHEMKSRGTVQSIHIQCCVATRIFPNTYFLLKHWTCLSFSCLSDPVSIQLAQRILFVSISRLNMRKMSQEWTPSDQKHLLVANCV